MEACRRKPEGRKKHTQHQSVFQDVDTDGSNATKEQDVKNENLFSFSCENLTDTVVLKVRKRPGLIKRSASTDKLFDEEPNTDEDEKLSLSWENLLEAASSEGKTRPCTGTFRKSPQPAPRSIATEDPLSATSALSSSWERLPDAAEGDFSATSQVLASKKNLSEATGTSTEAGNTEASENTKLRCRRTIKEQRQIVSFRIKKTFPRIPEVTLSSQTSDDMPVNKDKVELHELRPAQESRVELQPVEMAARPSEHNPPGAKAEPEPEGDELMEWWSAVKGWTEWYETSNLQEDDEETAVEQAADRVYLAARVFVRLFNQRGGSLQRRILELLSLADAADHFHRKTVSAAVGGGVASVAGSVATITGLILAPFTFGASVIVTAVGISVATAGGITSATANITDTVHSRMDRKKVEKMIQGYQEEISDIRECLEFVQEGMDTLQEWDFERYSQQAAKKALNHNVKTVLRAGGSAGRALVINTEKLISTVQVLRAAGGAVKGARVMSVATGVMSALFLALDVFFLAKDSHELRKGAKTQFAAKIREVCKELQQGLLELNKVKTQLQKTMDGIEVEEYEEVQEVEVEIEEDLESDPKKLHELEQELDLLEEKLDKKVEEEQKKKKSKENERKKKEEEKKHKSKLEKCPEVEKGIQTQESVKSAVEALEKEQEKHTQECRQERPLHDDRRVTDGKRGKRGEEVRGQCERRVGEEEETGNRREDGESETRGKEHEQRGFRPRANALLGSDQLF